MAGLKRTDNKGRILKDGESQRKDGSYRYRYTDADGVRRDVYSKRLVPTDRLPPGCKDDLSLREKERKINRDLEDGIKAAVENKATLNDLFELYMANKPELKDTTRSNYLYMYNKYVRNDINLEFTAIGCCNRLIDTVSGNREVDTVNLAVLTGLYNLTRTIADFHLHITVDTVAYFLSIADNILHTGVLTVFAL